MLQLEDQVKFSSANGTFTKLYAVRFHTSAFQSRHFKLCFRISQYLNVLLWFSFSFKYLFQRAKPVRSQASRTLLIFLRYNLKEIQRKWIRDNLITHLCYSKSCYTRHVFILACVHAAELFSNSYFKKHFFEPLLSLAGLPLDDYDIHTNYNVKYCR